MTENTEGEKNKTDNLLKLSLEVLKLLGRAPASDPEGARAILELIRAYTGIEAAAIRLRSGEDFPYHAGSGFLEEFMRDENFLCARSVGGRPQRAPDGKVLLECMCGNILCGKGSSEFSYYTPGGSFWTNSTTKLLAGMEEKDRPLNPRNRCNKAGYESMALIPLKTDGGIIGLLQLNDRRTDRYTPELIRFFEELSSAVAANISRELAGDELERSRKTKAVSRLASGMAHDLNNVLGAIRGYAEFIRADLPQDSPGRADAEEILTAADRAAAFTRQLLALSGSQLLSPTVLDLNKTAGGLAEMLGRIMGGGRKLEMRLEPVPCTVKADAAQIKQVITSLVVNALDAGLGDGMVTLETELVPAGVKLFAMRPDLPRGPVVRLSVTVGGDIGKETKNRLFEPFYTIGERDKAAEIGLAVAFGIARQSGGDIEVESAPGRGTAFRLYLPYTDEAPLKEAAAAGEAGAPAADGKTVLIVDDDEAILKVTSRVLRKNGYTVLKASGGKEALKLLEERGGPADLLVTDVAMPGMSGRELGLEVSRRNLAARTLYISGHTDEVIGKHGVTEPGLAFITKPFTHEAFLQKVRAVLAGPAGEAKA